LAGQTTRGPRNPDYRPAHEKALVTGLFLLTTRIRRYNNLFGEMNDHQHRLDDEDVPLAGGISTPGVVRVGDAVRRALKPDSDVVHALRVHFERSGFDGAPRFRGRCAEASRGSRSVRVVGRRPRRLDAVDRQKLPGCRGRRSGAEEWAATELAFMERNADAFRTCLG
jgi:hypothetical protein